MFVFAFSARLALLLRVFVALARHYPNDYKFLLKQESRSRDLHIPGTLLCLPANLYQRVAKLRWRILLLFHLLLVLLLL